MGILPCPKRTTVTVMQQDFLLKFRGVKEVSEGIYRWSYRVFFTDFSDPDPADAPSHMTLQLGDCILAANIVNCGAVVGATPVAECDFIVTEQDPCPLDSPSPCAGQRITGIKWDIIEDEIPDPLQQNFIDFFFDMDLDLEVGPVCIAVKKGAGEGSLNCGVICGPICPVWIPE
ncbi:hypothetical protein [Ammoniphilus sp. CFH 90114]|uniref:hypothetical protein n=1 Tax=Ammoniphilus sp. CFH 90114 TaxID=2493665 RepID=UPI00100F3C66|nr:hypothetical protein [Ammoniphilus sp. CFH 90114]RXT13968.1 hypothetical protein EIZ39_07490 [Ammoniphilus sp. CFH 90114]